MHSARNIHMSSIKLIEVILLSIKLPIREPEANRSQTSNNRHREVIPLKFRIHKQRQEGFSQSRSDGGHEERERRNERTHILRSLREAVLQRRDRGKNLGESNEHIRPGLRPDIDVRLGRAARRLIAARGFLVDIDLDRAGPDHGEEAEEETRCDTLDGREADTLLPEPGVEKKIAEWDENDQSEGIEIVDDIVRDAVQLH